MLKGFHYFFEIYYAAFQGFCLQYFLGSFFEYRRKGRHWGWYVAVIYTVFRLCVNRLLPYEYEDIRIIEKQFVIFGMLALFVLIFYKASGAMTGYLVITFMAVSEISFFISHSMLQVGNKLYDIWIWCVEKQYITGGDMAEAIFHATAIGLQVLMYSIFSVLCFCSLKSIVHDFREKDYPMERMELYFLLVPGMAGLLVCALLKMIMAQVENGMSGLLYGSHPVLILVIPAILMLCLTSIIYSTKLFQSMVLLNREKNSRAILKKQVENMQGQITEMEHIYSSIRGMKHDMGTTLAVITQLMEEDGKKAELQDYLSELNQTFDRLELQYKTGNAVVDTLLSIKRHELTRIMPDVKLNAERLLFPENLKIQSYDIGVIIGNALDNAMEGCKKTAGRGIAPFIRISSYARAMMFFIKVENSFGGKVIRRAGVEFPMTDKPDKKAHGIGLLNIKNTAEKYHGGVDWQARDGVFTLTVMLKNEKSTV